MSNSFKILLALSELKQPLSTTQISEKIAINSKGQFFKVSGALKGSLENRLRKDGYFDGTDIPNQKRIVVEKNNHHVLHIIRLLLHLLLKLNFITIKSRNEKLKAGLNRSGFSY